MGLKAEINRLILKIAKEYDLDSEVLFNEADKLDWDNFEEAKKEFLEKVLMLISDSVKRAEFREKYISKVKIELEKVSQQKEEYENKEIRKIIENAKPLKDHPLFEKTKLYIKALLESEVNNLLVVYGEAGLGKTTVVLDALNELKVDYEYLNGVSPFGLYKVVVEKPSSLIVLDDITIDTNMIRLLKALTDTKKERIVTWVSRATERSAQKTIFTGKVILIANDVLDDTNEHYTALLNRALKLPFRLSEKELFNFIRTILGEDYDAFKGDINEIASEVGERYVAPLISVRVAKKYKDVLKVSRKLAYEVLINEILERAKVLMLANKLTYSEFEKETGLSKSTWKRYRRMYRKLEELKEGVVENGVK